MKRSRIVPYALACSLIFSLAWAAGFCRAAAPAKSAVPALVTAMQERYAQIQTFRTPFTQKLTHKESGAQDTREGLLTFQRPLRIRWETNAPARELLVVTDKEVWHYAAEDKTAIRYARALAGDSRSIIQVVTGQSRLDQDFTVEERGRDGALVILALYPHEPTMQFTEGRLWVDPATRFIRRAEVIDFYGNSNDIALGEMILNLSYAADTFSFSPPPGVRVEDHLQSEESGNPLLR
jgi:outer membrane lipoprotein carrier protein